MSSTPHTAPIVCQGESITLFSCAWDSQTSTNVVIKKLRHPFIDPAYAKMTYREVVLMLETAGHENVCP